jgi:tyrosyl-tRNA synthetase
MVDVSTLSKEELRKLELFKRRPTEEILTEEQLVKYIMEKQQFRHYIGYEISGYVHLGTGIVSSSKIADFQEAGAKTTIFLADLHAWINKKLGGDLDAIRKVAKGYFGEAMKASLRCVGGNVDETSVVLASELYEKLGEDYFETVIKIANSMTLARAMRSITIMGRKQGESISLSQLVYVPMQVADIFAQQVNIAHAGMDQRKAHVVAIEVAGLFDYKPVAIHHHLLLSMQLTDEERKAMLNAKQNRNTEQLQDEYLDIKMSKSKPNTAIFVHDSEEEIRKKIGSAYCPAGELEFNPVIDIVRNVVWPYLTKKGEPLVVENKKKGTTDEFAKLGDLEKAFASMQVHPADLKQAVAAYLIRILEPARKYFEGPGKKYLEEMESIKITR